MKCRHAVLLPVLLAAVLALSLAAGCKQLEQSITGDTEAVTQEATVASPAASVKGEVDPDVPETLPVWPGATVSASDAADGTITLTLETTATFTNVIAGTSVGFERAGWEVAEEASEPSATVLTVSGEGYDGFVTITEAPDAVTLDYVLAERTGS